MNKQRIYISISLAALALAWVTSAAAQATEEDQADQAEKPANITANITMDEIIVTANRIEQRLSDVPASITAETLQTLERRGATQLDDIIKTIPGITNPGPGGGNASNPTIRNVTSGTTVNLTQSTVALLFDDIPVDPSIAAATATNLRTVDIQRVEVLRGPQGSLFGSGSLSGMIRFISNKPDASAFTASGEITSATTRHGGESYWGNAVLNVPLVYDKVAVRIVEYHYSEGGYVDDIETGEEDLNDSTTFGGRISLLITPNERASIQTTAIYQKSQNEGSYLSAYDTIPGRESTDHATTRQLADTNNVSSFITNATIKYDFGAVELLSSSSYLRRKFSDLSATRFNDVVAIFLGLSPLAGEPAPYELQYTQKVFVQELRLTYLGDGPFRWTFGGFYLNDDIAESTQVVTSPALEGLLGDGNLFDFDGPGKQRELAVFGDFGYRFGKWSATAGLRISETLVRFETLSSGLLAGVSAADAVPSLGERKERSVLPRFTLSYYLNDDFTLYASASRGFRTAGPNLAADISDDVTGFYESDSLWNYEIGEKVQLLDGRLILNGSLYLIDWKDIQTNLVAGAFAYVGNAGRARIVGVEMESLFRPVETLDIGLSFSVSHGETREEVPDLSGRATGMMGVMKGERLPATPEVTISGYVQKTFSIMEHESYARVSAQHSGAAYTDFSSLGSRFGNYTTVDLRVGVYLGAIELTAFVGNILDSDGRRSAADVAETFGVVFTPQSVVRVRPRTVGLTLRAALGQ